MNRLTANTFITTSLFLYYFMIPAALGESFPEPTHKLPLAKSLDCPCPQLMAHRGASGNYPDSSALAFLKAKEFNTDILELDVHLSADEKIIVSHDPTLERVTGKNLNIHELHARDIKKEDAGYTFTKDNEDFPFRNKGITVLTLNELYILFPRDRFNVELKTNDKKLADKVWQFVKENNLQQRLIVGSAHQEVLDYYRSIKDEEHLTSASAKEIVRAFLSWPLGLSLEDRSFDLLQIPHNFLTKSMVQYFHKQGLIVQVWTVNKEEHIRRMLEIGVDGIMTDYPERAYKIYQEFGHR